MEKLLKIQTTLKAPKNQRNNFGKYNYRSVEDILEAVKPLLAENQATLTLHDELELIGDWHYIKAVATFKDLETKEEIQVTAYARESEIKKGMDSAQVTGATSSYARKYALNGLFLIDDNKDADTDEYANVQRAKRSTGTGRPKQQNNAQNDKGKEYFNLVQELANEKNLKPEKAGDG